MSLRSSGETALREPSERLLEQARSLASTAPHPAQVGAIACGTAGWTDRTLLASKRFYPPGLKSAAERLRFYARHFSLVEVDATYYSLLPVSAAEGWIAATPRDFVVNIKANPLLTQHAIDLERLPRDLREEAARAGLSGRAERSALPRSLVAEIEGRFGELLDPLLRAGRLGAVLAQFPPWFDATRGNARWLEQVRERWAHVPLAVEFRHPSWLESSRRARLQSLLEANRLGYVCVDEPVAPGGGVPPVVMVGHPELAMLRLHGHNVGGWRRGASVAERFDYLYAPAEIEPWVESARELSSKCERVQVIFNNCVRDYAVLGAKGFAALLSRERRATPGC